MVLGRDRVHVQFARSRLMGTEDSEDYLKAELDPACVVALVGNAGDLAKGGERRVGDYSGGPRSARGGG